MFGLDLSSDWKERENFSEKAVKALATGNLLFLAISGKRESNPPVGLGKPA